MAHAESIAAARQVGATVSAARRRLEKALATRARRQAERRDPEGAAVRYVRGYAD